MTQTNTQNTPMELGHAEGCEIWESRMKHISLPQRVKAMCPGNGHYEGTAIAADGRVIERGLNNFGMDRFWVWPNEAAWADCKASTFDPEKSVRQNAAAPETAAERDRLKASNAELVELCRTASSRLRELAVKNSACAPDAHEIAEALYNATLEKP